MNLLSTVRRAPAAMSALARRTRHQVSSRLRPPLSGLRHGWGRARSCCRRPLVWGSGLAAFVATVTIAAIPSNQPLSLPATGGLSLTPPRQINLVANPEGTVVESTIPGWSAGQPLTAESADESGDSDRIEFRVRSGDTISQILDRADINDAEVLQAIRRNSSARLLYQLYPGQRIVIRRAADKTLLELTYHPDETETLRLVRHEGALTITREARTFEARQGQYAGTIRNSLFVDGGDAGLSDGMILRMAEIFGYDIDFALDLREGDRFMVLTEEKFWQGQKMGDGEILAAEFVNQGKTFRAIGYRDEKGTLHYFTPDGLSLRRSFLRTPVEFSRITSRFSLSRYHPVLKTWRAHSGVDYGAPTGTPVRATSAGRVEFIGQNGGYGNVIILRHGGSYTTLYAHLSRFHRALRNGSPVEQGQVIGYVGATGLATGPHLHYEFRVNDTHRNPLTYKFPSAEPIAGHERRAFSAAAAPLLDRLDRLQRLTTVAQQ